MEKNLATQLQEMGEAIDVKVTIYEGNAGRCAVSFRDHLTTDPVFAFRALEQYALEVAA